MKNKAGLRARKHITYIVSIVLLYVLQSTPGLFEVYGIQPDFVIPVAVCIAICEGELTGGLYGAFAGVLCDLGAATLFGFNGMTLLVCCTAVGLATAYLLRTNLMSYVMLLFATLAVRGLLDYLLSYVMWGYEDVWMVLVYNILPSILYSAAVSPLFYWLFTHIFRSFEKRLDDL